jgi:alginate O-acetyltransferase complex protein AlgI
MLFNTLEFALVFLPACLVVFYFLARFGRAAQLHFLIAASLVFFSQWLVRDLLILCASILCNFALGLYLRPDILRTHFRKALLVCGIGANVALLGYYKYVDFLLQNLNEVFGLSYSLLHIALPLALSFYTFQQIAFLVDSFQGKIGNYSLSHYFVFVAFFPQLIAGPIVHHSQIIPQMQDATRARFNSRNFSNGLVIFSIGLIKKIVLADTFAVWADASFSGAGDMAFYPAWCGSLSYYFQIYFDFSGYCDMAIGAALAFNIQLPQNFNSPYRALNIRDFWRRWHITLSSWLRDYIYVPMGGNQRATGRIYLNLMATFVIGGVWHGAGWNFLVWGLLHGGALSVNRLLMTRNISLYPAMSWLLTFLFLNVTWVFFRADNLSQSVDMLAGMVGLNGLGYVPEFGDLQLYMESPSGLEATLSQVAMGWPSSLFIGFTLLAVVICSLTRNSYVYMQNEVFGTRERLLIIAGFLALIFKSLAAAQSPFLYFQF